MLAMADNNIYVAGSIGRAPASALPEPADEAAPLDLERDRVRTEMLWQRPLELDVPMCVAAATVFHRVHARRTGLVRRSDYETALNIAAATLSWLVPVYTVGLVTGRRVPVAVNLLTQRFAAGATQLRSLDGDKLMEALFVRRPDLLFALPIIQRAGLPL